MKRFILTFVKKTNTVYTFTNSELNRDFAKPKSRQPNYEQFETTVKSLSVRLNQKKTKKPSIVQMKNVQTLAIMSIYKKVRRQYSSRWPQKEIYGHSRKIDITHENE